MRKDRLGPVGAVGQAWSLASAAGGGNDMSALWLPLGTSVDQQCRQFLKTSGPAGYITPAAWGFPNTSERGTKSEVAHKWAHWLHACIFSTIGNFFLCGKIVFFFCSKLV